MTSTDSAPDSLRLPPLAGLLDDIVDEALRARRRRVMVADNPAMTLKALRVTDNTLDRLVRTASLYGPQAVRLLDQRIAELAGDTQEAAVFLRMALSMQDRRASPAALAAHYIERFPRAVREACWFYPVPASALGDDVVHLVELFERGASCAPLRLLAIELAGLRAETRLRAPIAALLDHPDYAAPATLALARMGHADERTVRVADACLASGDPAQRALAMALVACDPRIAHERWLQQALAGEPAGADAAWAIATCRDPRRTVERAGAHPGMPAALRARIAALAGYPDGIVAACAAMTPAEIPVDADQAGLLQLTLGAVPLEARCDPNDAAAKSAALRVLLLRVLRGAHVGLCNDADIGPWEAGALLADPARAATLRLREGAVLGASAPPLGAALLEVPHALRHWLYIERACLGRHPLALSPFDVARRQDAAMMVGQFTDAFLAA